jgi:hypothetical protein
MPKTKDIRAVTGTYEQGGKTKNRYATVGALFEGEKGMVAKIDLIPTNPDWDGTLFFNDPYDVSIEQANQGIKAAREALEAKHHKDQSTEELQEDDIPF